MDVLNRAARAVKTSSVLHLQTMADVFHRLFPILSPAERQEFLNAAAQLAGVDEGALARQASLYLTSKQVRELACEGSEIGSHTSNHVHCRTLAAPDMDGEIDRNTEELEAISGKKVRSFSVPYGSSADLNSELTQHLKSSGYQAAFLSESVANAADADPLHIDRVSIRTGAAHALFLQIEILPRLRVIRNRLFHRRTLKRAHAKPPFSLTQPEYSKESLERTQN